MFPRQRWLFGIGGWVCLASAALHLIGFLSGRAAAPANDTERELQLLTTTYKIAFPAGTERSYDDLMVGFSLAMAGDVIVAARSASFIQVFSRIALVPDLGSTWLLPRLVGRQRALELMMTNEPLTAAQAKEWGLVREVFDDAALQGGIDRRTTGAEEQQGGERTQDLITHMFLRCV